MKKLILFDVDGTLVECQSGHDYISEVNKQAIRHLKETGNLVFIASGRPYSYIMKEIEDFGFDGYILSDGAYVTYLGQTVAYHPMDKDELKPLFDQAKEHNRTYIAYTKDHAYVFNDDGSLVNYCHTFKFRDDTIDHVDRIEDIEDQILKLHIQSKTIEDFRNMNIDMNLFYSANDQVHYLNEIYSRKYTKATALLELIKELNIDIDETYFFGDGFNDIEMMDAVGHPIAMDNAHDEVKKHAQYVCKSVLDDGIADFIENSGVFF